MSSITVLGQKIRIVRQPLDDKYGQFDSAKREIHLDPSYPRASVDATLLHEVLHAALHVGGISYALSDEIEEAVVRCIEHALVPLVQFKRKY